MTIRAQYTTTTPAFSLTTAPDNGTALPTTDPNQYGSRPLAALIQADGGSLRWTDDGTTPTASVGMILAAGSAMVYQRDLAKLQFIQVASGAKLNVTYYDRQEGNVPLFVQGSAELVNDVGSAINVVYSPLGQALMAASVPVTIASNQTAVYSDVSGSQFATVVTSNTITRPNDTTAYAVGDLIANSATAGSVTPFSWTSAATGSVVEIGRIRIKKSSTSVTNASFRVHLYNATPGTPANGDNGAWSTSMSAYIGAFDITVDRAFTDGSEGAGVPLVGSSILCKIASGTTLYGLLEARAAYTPAAQETFSIIVEAKRW